MPGVVVEPQPCKIVQLAGAKSSICGNSFCEKAMSISQHSYVCESEDHVMLSKCAAHELGPEETRRKSRE